MTRTGGGTPPRAADVTTLVMKPPRSRRPRGGGAGSGGDSINAGLTRTYSRREASRRARHSSGGSAAVSGGMKWPEHRRGAVGRARRRGRSRGRGRRGRSDGPSVRVGRRPLMEANRGRRWSPRWELAWRLLLGKRPDKASEVVRQGLWAGGLLRGALHVSSPPTTQQPCGRAAGFTRIIFHHVNTIIYPIFTHSDATVRRARGAPHLPSTRLACCQPPQVPLRPPQFEGQIFSRTVLVSLPFLSFLAVTSSLRSHARFDASPSFLRSGACSVCAAPRTGLVLLPGSVCSPFAHVAPSFITNAFPVSHRASYIVAFRR